MPAAWQIGALLEPGLRSEHAFVYQQQMELLQSEIGDIAWLDVTSDKLQEVRGFMETAGYFSWWPADSPPPTVQVSSQRFVVINRDFALRHVLPRNVEDDQSGTVPALARQFASAQATLIVDGFYQMMQSTAYNGTTAPFPTTITAADGTGPYSTAARYGSANGNVVTVTGTTTVQQIITDIISMKRRYIEFQNTQTRPFWVGGEFNKMTIFHGSSLSLVMQQAEFQTRVPWEVTSGANGTGQTPTNLLLQSRGLDIRYVNSQRITGTLYYSFLRGVEPAKRAFFRQVRKGLTQWDGTFAVSDYARDTGRVYVQADCRENWSSALMISSIRVGS